MVKHKPPATLYLTSLQRLKLALHESAEHIQNHFGAYDVDSSQELAETIRSYLSDHLPATVLRDVCNTRLLFPSPAPPYDPRIYLHMCLQPCLFDLSTLKLSYGEAFMPAHDIFWLRHLPMLSNLTSIEVHLLSMTDTFLSEVVKNCPKLEELRSHKPGRYEMTRLRRFVGCFVLVTSKGLSKLSACKQLRHLMLPFGECNALECSCYVQDVAGTEKAMLTLLAEVPLRSMGNYDLASLLVQNEESLPLLNITYLEIVNPMASHIATIDRLCPSLKTLRLIGTWQHIRNLNTAPPVFSCLADSQLMVTTFYVKNFYQSEQNFVNFITSKGRYLTSLTLFMRQEWDEDSVERWLDSNDILRVGLNCQSLTHLSLRNLRRDKTVIKPSDFLVQAEGAFANLKSLSLVGRGWNSKLILPLCLNYSLGMMDLHLVNHYYIGLPEHGSDMSIYMVGHILDDIIHHNPLVELECAHFSSNMHLIGSNLDHFLDHCPRIKKLVIEDGQWRSRIFELQEQFKVNNVDCNVFSWE